MRHLSTALKTIGLVAAVGLVGNSVSLAATGQGLVLGKGNTAKSATGMQRTTTGPVLSLKNKRATDARVDGIEAKATQADARATAAQGGVDAITPKLPIAQGYFLTDGSVAPRTYGIASATWSTANSRFEITLNGVDTFYPSQYVTQVTPEGPCTANYRGSGGKLVVETRIISTVVSTPPAAINYAIQCPFSLTVTRL